MVGVVVAAALAFVGAVLGSGLGWLATQRRTQVERDARRREEWGRRFTAALTAVTGVDPTQVAAGHALLLELVRSELATAEDRAQARAVLEVFATQRGPVDLRLVPPEELNQVDLVEDTGQQTPTEGDDR